MSKLRGGGCGSSSNVVTPQDANHKPLVQGRRILKLPTNLKANIKSNVEKITTETESDDTILNSLQYFFLNEYAFEMMLENQGIASQYVDLFQACISDLLTACARLVKSNGLFCNLGMQIAHWMSRVLLWFNTSEKYKKRTIEDAEVKSVLLKVIKIENQLDVEKNIHDTAIRYELYCIKVIFTIFPTNSEEGKDLAVQFLKGAIESFISMSPSDNLKDSIKGGVKMAIDEGYKLYCKSQYQKIFRIEKLKLEIIEELRFNTNFQISTQMKNLNDLYKQIHSSSWEIHYTWIKCISAIICLKPIQSKEQLKLNEQVIKELITEKAIIMINADNFLVSLNTQKLMSFEAQNLSNKIPMIKYIKEIQCHLISGNQWVPKFIDYSKKTNDQFQQQKLVSPNAYFKQFFKNIRFSLFTQQIDEINQIIENLQISQICTIQFDTLNSDEFQQNIIFMQDQLLSLKDKMLTISELYHKMKWISLEWDKFISQNSCTDLFQKEPFFKQLADDQNQLIQTIDKDFAVDLIAFKLDKVGIHQQTKEKYSYNQFQIEFIIQVYLRQLYRMAHLHLKNIQNLQKIHIDTEFLHSIIKTESQLSVPSIIQRIQRTIVEALKLIIKYPKSSIDNLQKNLKCLIDEDKSNTVQRNFVIPSNDLLHLDLCVQYEIQQKSLLSVIIQVYHETRELFMESQETAISAIYICKIKSDLERLSQELQGQETLRYKVIDLYKSVQFSEKRDIQKLKQAQEQFDQSLPQMDKIILGNDLAEQIVKAIFYAKDWQTQCNNLYREILELNPYDEVSQNDLNQESKKISQIIENLVLVQDIIKLELDNSLSHVQDILQKIKEQITTKFENTPNQNNDVDNNSKQEFDTEIQQYENLFLDLKIQLKDSLVNVGKIENQLQILKRIQLTCPTKNLPSNWLEKIKGDSLSKFDSQFIKTQFIINYNTLPRLNTVRLTEIIDTIFPLDSSQVIKDKTKSSLNTEQIRIKECVITQLFLIIDSCLLPNIKVEAELMILHMKTYEIDKKIRIIINSSDYAKQTIMILQQHWHSQQEKIVQEVSKGLKDLSTLQYEIQQENDLDRRKKLKSEYQIRENEIYEQLQNVSEIGSSLGITMLFVKDIKNELIRMEEKINQIFDNVKIISNDLQYLKGKTIYQLLDVRRQDIMMKKKMIDASKVYININCIEKKYDKKLLEQDGRERNTQKYHSDGDQSSETRWNELMGQVNIYLDSDQKTSLLLHGQAGSGKSTASRKIEEYLWEQYQKSSNKDCKIVPIVIQLPQLQDPLHQAMNETLRSESYRCSDNQIRDLKEEISQRRIKLVIIMDSYDELAEEWRGTNLIVSNKLSMWGRAQFQNYPKVISLTRSEALSSADYKENFLAEEQSSIKLYNQYKEIQILKFDKKQQSEYVEKYLTISVKRILYETYIQMIKNENQIEVFEQFIEFWDKIKLNLNMDKSKELLKPNAIQQLKNDLIQDKNIQIISQEFQRNMEVQLGELKSRFFYEDTIRIMKLENILETPFMMELVVEVLPFLIKFKSQQGQVKRFFIPKYQELLQIENKESSILNAYKADQAWNNLVQNHQFFETFLITQDETEIQNNLKTNVKNINKDITKKLELYTTALKSRTLTQYDFYQSFLSLFFQKTISKQKEHTINRSSGLLLYEIWRFAKNLAVDMSLHKKTQIEYQVKGLLYEKETTSWDDKYFDDDGEKGQYRKLFRDCIPLRQQNSSYSFNHKSLQEFLVAKDFIKWMRVIRKQILYEQTINVHMTDTELKQITYKKFEQLKEHFVNKQSWSRPFMNGTCAFIVQKGMRKPDLRKIMYSAVQLTNKKNFPDNEMIYLGSNCLFLLVNMGENFMDKDLEDICVKEINLSGANFAHCNLNQSEFTDVNISGINLYKADLHNIKWTNIEVGLYPDIEIGDFKPKKLVYTEKGYLIIGGRQEIQYCCDFNKTLIKFEDNLKIKLHYFQNMIFAKQDKTIKVLDVQNVPKLLLQTTEIIPIKIVSKISIKRIQFLEDELYYLDEQSEIHRCNLKNLTSGRTTLKFKEQLTNMEENAVVQKFWLSDKNIMICTNKKFYQLVQIQLDEFSVESLTEITGRCKYYPKYRLLLQNRDGDDKVDKIELIDPIRTQNKEQEQKEEEEQKKQQSLQANQQNLMDEFNPSYKTQEQVMKTLLADVERKKEEEQQHQQALDKQQNEEPKYYYQGKNLKVIKLNSLTEYFLLWSSNEIKSISVTVSLKDLGVNKHNLDVYRKKALSNNNKILVTLHSNKVIIWDVDRLETIYQLELNDIKTCVIDKNDILTMYKKEKRNNKQQILKQIDLKSQTQSMQLQFRKLICTPRSQNFIAETTDGHIYFYQHKGREFNSKLISQEGSSYLWMNALGQQVLILEKYRNIYNFWNTKTKEFDSYNKFYAFANGDIKFRYQSDNHEIYFMKGNQLYKVERNVASIQSPAKVLQKKSTLDKIYKTQEQKAIVDSMIITKDKIYILINGQLIQYELQKGIQQNVAQTETNITKILICNNKKQTIYFIVDNNTLYRDSIEKEPIYVTKEDIIDIIQLQNENDLALRHKTSVRRLTILPDIIQQKSFPIRNSSWVYYALNQLFIGFQTTIHIYNLEINDRVNILDLKNKIPTKMCQYFDKGFLILCNQKVYKYIKNKYDQPKQIKRNPEGNCLDLYYDKNILIIRYSDVFIGKEQYNGRLYRFGDYKFNEQWNHQQIVEVNNRYYLYGIKDYQIVRSQIFQRTCSNQVMASLEKDYQTVKGFDLSHKYLVYYTQNNLYIKELDDPKQQEVIIDCDNGLKTIQICSNNKFLMTSNLFNKIYIYTISEAFSKDSKKIPIIIETFKSINRILWVQEQILVLEDKKLFVINSDQKSQVEEVANMKNGFKEISATETGFNILNKDHSIDIYQKQQCMNNKVYSEKYVRVQVFNASSNQSINSYGSKYNKEEAVIKSSNGFNLIGLLEEKKND